MHNVALILFCVGHVFRAIPAACIHADEGSPPNCFVNASDSEIGGRARCTFETRIDFDQARFPLGLPYVKCKCLNSICSKKGDFRCVEVPRTFEVFYLTTSGRTYGTVELPTSCVCATSMVLQASPLPHRPVWCRDIPATPLEMPVSENKAGNHSEGVPSAVQVAGCHMERQNEDSNQMKKKEIPMDKKIINN